MTLEYSKGGIRVHAELLMQWHLGQRLRSFVHRETKDAEKRADDRWNGTGIRSFSKSQIEEYLLYLYVYLFQQSVLLWAAF